MTTVAQWVEGARPRTLPAAVAPVLVGTGAAAAVGDFRAGRALLALVVALALQVAVNYANDYSDGIRGTDTARVGPLRLVGSGVSSPAAVKRAAVLAFAVAAVAGLVLAALTAWWLVAVGAAAMLAAWFYTGGARPYGYRALGEISVFVFFGLVATLGTTYVQAGRVTVAAVAGGVAVRRAGLRDPGGQQPARHPDRQRHRQAHPRGGAGRPADPPALPGAGRGAVRRRAGARPAAARGRCSRWPRLPLAVRPARTAAGTSLGRDLVPVLRDTGRLQLAYAALLALGLALS